MIDPTTRVATAVAVALALIHGAPFSQGTERGASDDSVVARFEGTVLDLQHSWGSARACFADEDAVRCYRSETEMDAAEQGRSGDNSSARACTPSLRLYTLASYNGSVLHLTLSGSVLNLTSYGFNNTTSSYKVGSCDSRLFDTTSGGGLYPGTTSPGTNASFMSTGWDNRIGSIRII